MRIFIRKLVTNNFTWAILNYFYKIFYRFKFEKDLIEIEKRNEEYRKKEELLKLRFSDLTVQNGPFKGMRYPAFIAHGSSMFPKLLGTYESELHPLINKLLENKYEHIMDIGCAEGYYAVGMAVNMPRSKIIAYDINSQAVAACKKMAGLNAAHNLTFGDFCSPQTLKTFDFGSHSLIICDCEGYELDLFNEENISNLKNCDILIELHDLYNEKISYHIDCLFSQTHQLEYIYSENTFKRFAQLKHINAYTEDEIKTFFTERNGIMQWVYISKK